MEQTNANNLDGPQGPNDFDVFDDLNNFDELDDFGDKKLPEEEGTEP
jgi:hypothetical protein